MLALRGVAAAFLVAFAALLPLPLQAEAQAEVWSSTLTVRDSAGVLGCSNDFANNHCSVHLSDDDFMHASTDYAILLIFLRTNGRLEITFDTNLATATQGLTLNIDGTAFAFEDADSITADARKWNSSGLSWSAGDSVSLTLTEGASTDALLSGLDLEDASDDSVIALSPTFASGTTTYTAMVGYSVNEITILPEPNDANATYEIQDGTGTALTDADLNTTGFQVDLSEGDNTIKVEVTAEDGSTQPYRVVVTRSRRITTTPPAPPEIEVPNDWSLIPAGLGAGDKFRLLFLSSTKSNATSYDIADYNTFIQGLAAAGHTDIQTYSSGFRAVGCTADSDATANTDTTGAGMVIHWLNGNKAADNYGDFYDGDWDDEANDKDEDGSNGPNTNNSGNYPFTGCDHDGTEILGGLDGTISHALGTSDEVVQVARPNSSTTGHGPLSSDNITATTNNRPMYGLSQIFLVAAAPGTAAVTVLPTTLTVTEQDADGDTYTVVLDTEPTANVVVTVAGHASTDVTPTPTALTFTTGNWGTARTVTVKAGDDADTTSDTVTLTHSAASTDSSYSGITIASVTVTVEDNDNNPPVFSQGTSATLSFSGAAGNVGAVVANDPDDGDTLTYSLGGTHAGKFSINPQTGQISTGANETYTPGDSYTVTVTADDGNNGGTGIITVTIRVRTVTPPPLANGSPEFGASSATRSMEETVGDAGAETAVSVGAPVTAADPEGDTIEYSLGGADGDKFDIDSSTGQILGRAGERYDYEEKQSYEVTVSASDGEGGTDTIEVTINIDNVSEAPEAPGAPRVRASGMTSLGVTWSAPRNAGRPEIEGYDLRYRNTAETDWSDGPGGVEETETDVPGLLEDTEYEVQVRAVNAEGAGEWSQAASGRTGVQSAGVAVAWLGRFGRTVAEHVLSGVSARITALRSSGMKAALGGLDLFPVESPDEPEHEDREEFRDWFGEEEEDSFRFLTMAGNDIKTRSSFVLGRSSGGGFGAVWGSGAFGGFNGRESGVSFEGDVRTGMLGADYAVGGLVGGVALSRSVGEGSYRNGRGSGKVKSSVTGIYPYAGNELSEKFSVWAVAGYGRGEMKVTLPGDGESGSADIYMKMAAAGARGDLVSGADEAGIGLSVEMDTLFVRTTSDGGRGIEAVEADVSRVRLSVEGSLGHALGDGGMLRPLIEAGIRRDGGDAETGFGADLGAGLQFSDTSGELSMQIMGRTLVVHEAGGFQDWGVSGSIRYDPYPDSPRGLMISLAHSAGGASDGGADALLGRGTLEGLGDGEAVEWNSRLVGEAGYGFGVFGGVFTGTPYAGFGASEGLRDYYLGLRLARMNRDAFDLEFGVEATREESAGAYDPIHGMTFRLALRR